MDEIKHREQVDLIREVFYYQNRFAGKTIVLKIDYPILNRFPLPATAQGPCHAQGHRDRNYSHPGSPRMD